MIRSAAIFAALCSLNLAAVSADLQCFQARDAATLCPTDKPLEGNSLQTSDATSQVVTPTDCYTACMNDFTCNTWEYSGAGLCTLYTATIQNVYYSTGTSTGSYFGSWNCPPVASRASDNCDYSNPNYGYASVSAYRIVAPDGDCQTACADDVTCNTWGTQITSSGTQCALYHQEFSAIFQLYPTDELFGSWDCPAKSRRANDCTNLPEDSGSDNVSPMQYSSLQTDMDTCYSGCFDSPICNAWSYSYGLCYYYQHQIEDIYEGTLGTQPISLSTWDCPPNRLYIPCDENNPDIGSVGEIVAYATSQVPIASQCQNACYNDPDCQTWGYDKNQLQCSLYSPNFETIFQLDSTTVLYGTWSCVLQRPSSNCIYSINPVEASADITAAYSIVRVPSPYACEIACSNDDYCYTWLFQDGQCGLIHIDFNTFSTDPSQPSAVVGSWECQLTRMPQDCDNLPSTTGPPSANVLPYRIYDDSDTDSCLQACYTDTSCQTWGFFNIDDSCSLYYQDIGTISPASGETSWIFSAYNCGPAD